ncbi:MAG: TlpA disulfide reductase family protein [Planctomycetota bacterium]|nr:TlpA disulfide reductase family protein [Planctomycetota bacterium]
MKYFLTVALALALLVALPGTPGTAADNSGEREMKSIRKDLKKSNLKSAKKRKKYRKALGQLKELLGSDLAEGMAAEALDLYVESGFAVGEYADVIEAVDGALEEEIPEDRQAQYLLIKGQSLIRMIRFDEAAETLEALKDGPNKKDAKKALSVLQRVRQIKPVVGKPAPDINFKGVDGKMVNLSQLRGRVVLIDFWATWCGPCKVEMPNVIKTYEEFKGQGFEIVGISLDQSKESLEKYIAENKMIWPQYYDGKGWDNLISKYYGVSGIPATFLIDQRGNIASTNPRGPALPAAVKGLLRRR